jgi:hypothetical protein
MERYKTCSIPFWHPLNELLLGALEKALATLSSQFHYISQQAHQGLTQATIRFKGQSL